MCPPEQRIKALDALAFADMKAGSDRAATWLAQMDALITAHDLGVDEQLRVGMKRMNYLAGKGDRSGAMSLVEKLMPIIKALSLGHQRVFNYNVSCAELALGDADAAMKRINPLISDYYTLIGLTPEIVMGKNAPELSPMLKTGTEIDDVKHLADALDVLAKALDAQGEFSAFARIHALKFYDLARAPDSLFRVGQDLVDQFISKRDFDGALNTMESIVLPLLQQWKLADYLISVRSQYAVVLAYCERYDDAEAEMARLKGYESSLEPLAKKELEDQNELISRLRIFGPPPKWLPPQGLLEGLSSHFAKGENPPEIATEAANRKIGRNERCPCGSGERYKSCHGRYT